MCGVLEQAPAPALQSTTADLRVTNLMMPPRHQCGGKQPLLRRVGWNASRSTALSVWCVTVWCGMCVLEPVGVTAQTAPCDCTTDPAVVLRHIECVTLQFNSTPCDDLDDSVCQRPSMQHTTHPQSVYSYAVGAPQPGTTQDRPHPKSLHLSPRVQASPLNRCTRAALWEMGEGLTPAPSPDPHSIISVGNTMCLSPESLTLVLLSSSWLQGRHATAIVWRWEALAADPTASTARHCRTCRVRR
jgi:hypothetical protein